MMRSSVHHLIQNLVSEPPPLLPKRPYVAAIRDLSKQFSGVAAIFNNFGQTRTITTTDPRGLFLEEPGDDTLREYAFRFLMSDHISKALGLRHAELTTGWLTILPTIGHRMEFKQVLVIGDEMYPVRGGYVHVFMDKQARIFQVNSTVRHGRKPRSLGKIISENEAVKRACESLGVENCAQEKVELVISAHNDRFDPVYEVTITTGNPRRVVLVLVKAKTGQVVHQQNKLYTTDGDNLLPGDFTKEARGRKNRQPKLPKTEVPGGNVPAKTFLEVPDADVDLMKQIHSVVLEALPDPAVLKNKNLVVYVGSRRQEVRCKPDKTFMFKPGERQFSAVVAFFVLHSQIELYKSWGMKAPEKPIEVFVDDPSVRNNALFDSVSYEIHIGVGSGLPRGLRSRIVYDIDVDSHEDAHHAVYLQAAGNDLPGLEGAAIHESMGDVLGSLLMGFWFRLKYSKELGKTLTVADIDADPRVIGRYAAGAEGIRSQKNTARTPENKVNEPHDDGLISGGAQADLLVAMVKKSQSVEQSLVAFGKMTLAALALVPAHKVTFKDLLMAYLTADQQLSGGSNKELIKKSFGDHGIVLT